MEITIHDLHELALLVSVLDLGKLHDATGVTFSKSTRIHNVASIDAEAFAREVAQAPTGGEDVSAAYTSWLRDAIGVGEQHAAGLISTKFADEKLAKLGLPPINQLDPNQVSCAGEPIVDGKPHVFQDIQAGLDAPAVELDSNGLPWDERIHSKPADPAKRKNADGSWRARRGVDEATVQAVTAELRAKQAEHAADEAQDDGADEPVATETHALPTSAKQAMQAAADAADPVAVVDLSALIEASQETAGDSSDSLTELLAVSRDFISAHSTAAFSALKAAVAPLTDGPEHNGAGGKAIQALTPSERRLLRACIANYALFA